MRFAILSIFSSQFNQLKAHTFSPLYILKKILRALILLVDIGIILLVRLIRPFVLIRFGTLYVKRIGHLALNTEINICRRKEGHFGRFVFDFFYDVEPVSNRQLLKMWKRVLFFHPHVARLAHVNRLIPGGQKHEFVLGNDRDIYQVMDKYPCSLSFTQEELEKGRRELKKIGIPEDAKFIIVHSRDNTYLAKEYPGDDYTRHDHRDSTIENFIPSMQAMAEKGYYVVRTGAVSVRPLDTENPKIIDYATHHRTDFLDIFLLAHCAFYLGDSCGFYCPAAVFRRPVAFTNFVAYEWIHVWASNQYSLFKLVYSKAENRYLTFPEIYKQGIGKLMYAQDFIDRGLELHENTVEDIIDLANEIMQRESGTWVQSAEDDELQEKFWSSWPDKELLKNEKVNDRC